MEDLKKLFTNLPNIDTQTVALPPDEMLSIFMKLDDNKKEVQFIMHYIAALKQIPSPTFHPKKRETSEKHRLLADKIISEKGSLDSAIENYTKAIAYAPPQSAELALAFGARAAALVLARLYEDSLRDIDAALKLNYPKHLAPKLYAYQAKCLAALRGSRAAIKEAASKVQKSLEKLQDADKKIVDDILDDVKKKASIPAPLVKWDETKLLPKVPNSNSKIRGASDAIEVSYSKNYGRHIVATRDIKCGETLFVHESYASSLIPETFYTHCSNCLKQTWSGIPCEKCVNAVYCSENCRHAAWDAYHDIECQVLDSLMAADMKKLERTALQVTIKALKEFGGVRELKRALDRIDSITDPIRRGYTGDVLDCEKYASFYTLMRSPGRDPSLTFKLAYNSALMLYFLAKQTKIFSDKYYDFESLPGDKWTAFLGGLIMKNLEISKCSGDHIRDHCPQIKDPKIRGTGTWPFLSLFNHSCEQMMYKLPCLNYAAVLALHDIKKGEQVFSTYGAGWTDLPRDVRRLMLKNQHLFDCECLPCQNHWSSMNFPPSFQCLPLSEKLFDTLTRFMEDFAPVTTETIKPDVKEALKTLKLLWSSVQQECGETAMVQSILQEMYKMTGNRLQLLGSVP